MEHDWRSVCHIATEVAKNLRPQVLVAEGVVHMMMGVDFISDRFIGDFADLFYIWVDHTSDHHGVDHHYAIVSDYEPGVTDIPYDPTMYVGEDVRRDLSQSRLPRRYRHCPPQQPILWTPQNDDELRRDRVNGAAE